MDKDVTIRISEQDYQRMLEHFAKDRPGRPLVAALAVIDVEPGGDDRPMSPALCQASLAESANDGYRNCPVCDGAGLALAANPAVLKCEVCGALFTADVPVPYRSALQFVDFEQAMLSDAPPDQLFYFDFVVRYDFLPDGSGGVSQRTHGWADKWTRRVVQYG